MRDRAPRRVDMTGCENVDHIGTVRAAEAMAAAIDLMVHRRIIDARSPAADARLLYGDDQDHPTWSEEEAIEILGDYLPSFRWATATGPTPTSRAEDWPRGDANVPARVQEALDAEAAAPRAEQRTEDRDA